MLELLTVCERRARCAALVPELVGARGVRGLVDLQLAVLDVAERAAHGLARLDDGGRGPGAEVRGRGGVGAADRGQLVARDGALRDRVRAGGDVERADLAVAELEAR